jgi:hypothetical protein
LFGWSIAWRQFLWSLAIGIPLVLLVAGIVNNTTPDNDVRGFVFALAFYPPFLLLMVLLIFPKAIRAAISKAFGTFRVQVDKRGSIESLTYADSLQISMLAVIVSMVLGALYSLMQFPSVRLGLLAEVPLLLFVIYPAIAEVAVNVRFRGFRLVVRRG